VAAVVVTVVVVVAAANDVGVSLLRYGLRCSVHCLPHRCIACGGHNLCANQSLIIIIIIIIIIMLPIKP
jgi:hypothetical protein